MMKMELQFFAHKKGVGSTKNGRDSAVDGVQRHDQSDLSSKPFIQVQQSRGDHPVLLRDHQHSVLRGTGVSAVDGFRASQQSAHTVGIDEAQLLVEQATDKVTIAVQHIVFGLGRRVREVIFLRVQDFMYFVQKIY